MCPTCGALPGELCKMRGTNRELRETHVARLRANKERVPPLEPKLI